MGGGVSIEREAEETSSKRSTKHSHRIVKQNILPGAEGEDYDSSITDAGFLQGEYVEPSEEERELLTTALSGFFFLKSDSETTNHKVKGVHEI